MKTKEQKVEKYSNLYYAKNNIEHYLDEGWLVHTCMPYQNNDEYDGILVIYEREYEWQI